MSTIWRIGASLVVNHPRFQTLPATVRTQWERRATSAEDSAFSGGGGVLRHRRKAPVGIECKDALADSAERSVPEPMLGRGVQDFVPGLPHQEVGRTRD